jgi:hypothetical protein
VGFQAFHGPTTLEGSFALILALAALVACLGRDRTPAVLVIGGLGVALAASAAGFYPFGPSRHNVWLLPFTLPAIGWSVGRLVRLGPRMAAVGLGALVLAGVGGVFLGPRSEEGPIRTNRSEELVLRQREIAPLVVDRLDPEASPELVLMNEQAYDLLIPVLFQARRQEAVLEDRRLLAFRYGRRTVVVWRRWDWQGIDEVRQALREVAARLPDAIGTDDATFLLVAGGWGSALFLGVPELQALGAISDASWAVGEGPDGEPTPRLLAAIVERGRMESTR